MVRGLYTSATGMMIQRDKMNVLTNNIVNAETTGFKKDTVTTSAFTKVMLDRINDPGVSVMSASEVGPYSYGARVDEETTDFADGSYEKTDKPTDLAISGNGFFTVETPAGERYTRAGNFTVDGNGYLVTEDGNYVLGQNGRIQVGSTAFSVSADGTVTSGGAEVGRLKLETFGDVSVLRKQGNNLFYAYGGAASNAAAGASVHQGMTESSNVDISDEMVDMLTLYRKYEANQKAVTMTDESMGLADNLGKLGG